MPQLRPEQLGAHLARELAPVYLLHGDEPLQMAECADAIRVKAREAGCGERQVFNVDVSFDWDELTAASGNLSLFSERRLMEVRLPTGKPGEMGARALKAYAADPPADVVLLVLSGKLESQARRSQWVKALENAGVGVTVWPVAPAQLPGWIGRRMQARGLEPTRDALQLLADRVEGNLLACHQEIEKLYLLYGPGEVDAERVAEAVTDSARFDVFNLLDAALLGQPARVYRMLAGLRAEAVEPPQILWALARELRELVGMAGALRGGENPGAVLARHRVWEKRKAAVGAALKRHSARKFERLLCRVAHLDRVAKGRAPGSAWDELIQLLLDLAGAGIFTDSRARAPRGYGSAAKP
jgi:DNA polymerase-3 subunit delta